MLKNKLRLEVRDGALYAANTGRPFDRKGVIAICRSNLSAKGRLPPEDEVFSDEELVDGLLKARLESYQRDRNQLREDVNKEEEVSRDYEGRCLWELLQNADDAMAPPTSASSDLIGAKGLGFKSVLEISDRPEVHSGTFNFGFDADRSAVLLKQILPDPPRLTFRLPHRVTPDSTVRRLSAKGYVTIIRLPFRNKECERTIHERLHSLHPHFLLLSQQLSTVEIELPGHRRTFHKAVAAHPKSSETKLKVTEGEKRSEQKWKVWKCVWPSEREGGKRLSAALAVPIDVGTAGFPEIPLHVFYPTEESAGAPFLIHGSFEVTANRNHFRNGEQDEAVLDVLGDLARKAATELPAATVVRMFAPLARDRQRGVRLLSKKIIQRLAAAVVETPFIPVCGGGFACPEQVKTWSHRLGDLLKSAGPRVLEYKIAHPLISAVFSTLESAYGARSLSSVEAARALRLARCSGREDCLAALKVAQAILLEQSYVSAGVLDELAGASIWLTSGGKVRALTGKNPMVEASQDDWPAWLAAESVDPLLLEELAPSEPAARNNWDKFLDGRLLRSPNDFLRTALAPALGSWRDQDWDEHGWEVFSLLDRWLPSIDFEKVRPFVPGWEGEDPTRIELVAVMRAPSARNWVVAAEAFAGDQLRGPEVLIKHARAHGSSLINRPKPSKLIGQARWKALLRYVGVSWEPKFRKWKSNHPGPSKLSFHSDTDGALRYPQPDWYLDHFPACISGAAPVSIARMLESLLAAAAPLEGRWLKQWGSGTSHKPGRFSSYVDWQLRRCRYLPCVPGLDGANRTGVPEELFWPDKGLKGITPEVSLAGVTDEKRRNLQKVYSGRLGIQMKLPESADPWRKWAAELGGIAIGQPSRVSLRVARNFYENYLWRGLARDGHAPPKVLCETAEGMHSILPTDAIWLDKAELAPPAVHNALIQAGLGIFPVQLGRGEDAHTFWKVRRASQAVEIIPRFAVDDPSKTRALQERVEKRHRALAAVCETKNVTWNGGIRVKAVHDLRLEIRSGLELIAERPTSAVHSAGVWLINVDTDEFDALSRACSDGLAHATDLRRRLAAVLRARPHELPSVLLEEGIPTYRLRELQEADGDPDQDDDNADTWSSGSGVVEADATQPISVEGKAEVPSSSIQPDAGQSPASTGTLTSRSLYSWTGSRPSAEMSSRTPSGRRGAAEAAEAARLRGRTAEAWFADALKETMPSGWALEFNLRDEAQRESDVVLSNGSDWHIEVKSLTTELFFWSELERQKAFRHSGRYFMALMVALPAGGYRIHWCWDPMEDLKNCERRLNWVWDSKSEGPRLINGTWTTEDGVIQPRRPPDRIDNVVRITEHHLARLDVDDASLKKLWARIHTASMPVLSGSTVVDA